MLSLDAIITNHIEPEKMEATRLTKDAQQKHQQRHQQQSHESCAGVRAMVEHAIVTAHRMNLEATELSEAMDQTDNVLSEQLRGLADELCDGVVERCDDGDVESRSRSGEFTGGGSACGAERPRPANESSEDGRPADTVLAASACVECADGSDCGRGAGDESAALCGRRDCCPSSATSDGGRRDRRVTRTWRHCNGWRERTVLAV